MALSQEDRLAISKKLVSIPAENALIEQTQGQLEVAKDENQAKDNMNKSLLTTPTTLINAYQLELNQFDGNTRTTVVEQDFLDSANKKLQNPFFPNDPLTPLPSLPDGVWKNFIPFSQGKAIGKKYTEDYDTFDGEDQVISNLNSLIAQLETYNAANRSTLTVCGAGGSCSLPQYTTELTCTNGGGVWDDTPSFDPDPDLTQITDDIISNVNQWKTVLTTMRSAIPSAAVDPDASRQVENQAAKDDIDVATPIIDTWLAYPDSVAPPSSGDCSSFNSLTPDNFTASKFRTYELQPLKDEIAAREAFKTIRKGQLNTYLGSVTQDVNSGDITSSSGFYGDRFKLINLRLNLMAGSLNALVGSEGGIAAQEQSKKLNQDADDVYSAQITATVFTAPAAGTKVVHVKDASGFSVSDSVYVAANTQSEISATIEAINGNMVTLSTIIPKKYRQDDFARLYKVL